MSYLRAVGSVLSERPDGMGFYYGWAPPQAGRHDGRQVNVRRENVGAQRLWAAYLGGEHIGFFPTLEAAETAALEYAKATIDGPLWEEKEEHPGWRTRMVRRLRRMFG